MATDGLAVGHAWRCALAGLLSLALSACGGGDSDAPVVPPPPPVPLYAPPNSDVVVATDRAMDVGLKGEGLIATLDPISGEPRYTRRGRLDIDALGRLIDTDGHWVRGVSSGAAAGPLAQAGAFPVVPLSMAPRATTRVRTWLNFDAGAQLLDNEFSPIDPQTFNFSASVEIFDDDGTRLTMTLHLRKQQINFWHGEITVNGLRLPGAKPIELSFGSDGRLIREASAPAVTVDIPPEAGPTRTMRGVVVAVDAESTQFGAPFYFWGLSQDGYRIGALVATEVTDQGRLLGTYTNGQERDLGTLVLARFTVADRLQRAAQSAWSCGRECSPPTLGRVGDARMPALVPGALNTVY